MWARDAERGARDVAVLDVGSNSVRLVIYRLEGRAIWTVFNEKVLAGLGRGLAQTGRLSPDGAVQALAALRRFKMVLDAAKPAAIYTAATAAVREASDGPVFVEQVRRETGGRQGISIRVLSGEEEAYYSALGVAAGAPDATGVVGDLGGSSLELIPIRHGVPGRGVTLPLGPFALGAPRPMDAAAARARCDEALSGLDPSLQGGTLYAVGGAWRALGLLQMSMSDYPLQIVHQYELGAGAALDAARVVARQSKSSLERSGALARKRAETVPYAALVMEQVLERLGLERVSLSAFGVREGLIFEAMAPELRRLDPLVEGCAAFGAREGVAVRLAPALEAWLAPLWRRLPGLFEGDRDQVLLSAASRLADVGARLHHDHRADLAYDLVLRAPIAGQTHPERAFLAAAIFSRYTASQKSDRSEAARLLSPERLRRARALGSALRLGCDLSGRSPELLSASSLELHAGAVSLKVGRAQADMLLGEQTRKRFATLADALEVEPRLDVD